MRRGLKNRNIWIEGKHGIQTTRERGDRFDVFRSCNTLPSWVKSLSLVRAVQCQQGFRFWTPAVPHASRISAHWNIGRRIEMGAKPTTTSKPGQWFGLRLHTTVAYCLKRTATRLHSVDNQHTAPDNTREFQPLRSPRLHTVTVYYHSQCANTKCYTVSRLNPQMLPPCRIDITKWSKGT